MKFREAHSVSEDPSPQSAYVEQWNTSIRTWWIAKEKDSDLEITKPYFRVQDGKGKDVIYERLSFPGCCWNTKDLTTVNQKETLDNSRMNSHV